MALSVHGARVVSCVGGMDPALEQREPPQALISSWGHRPALRSSQARPSECFELKAVVLDEADEMLDMGFREDMELILKTTPESPPDIAVLLRRCRKRIAALADRSQNNAQRIEVGGDDGGHIDIEYRAMRVAPHDARECGRQRPEVF